LAAFNWNAIVAGWEVTSPYYLDHVTKIVSLSPLIVYVFMRGGVMPFVRGTPIMRILPIRFVLLSGVGAILDMTKFSSVIFSK
jgi:hypothetical protein